MVVPLPLFGLVVFDLLLATRRESGSLGFAFSNFVDSCEWGFRGRKPLVDSVSRPRFLPKIHNRDKGACIHVRHTDMQASLLLGFA